MLSLNPACCTMQAYILRCANGMFTNTWLSGHRGTPTSSTSMSSVSYIHRVKGEDDQLHVGHLPTYPNCNGVLKVICRSQHKVPHTHQRPNIDWHCDVPQVTSEALAVYTCSGNRITAMLCGVCSYSTQHQPLLLVWTWFVRRHELFVFLFPCLGLASVAVFAGSHAFMYIPEQCQGLQLVHQHL